MTGVVDEKGTLHLQWTALPMGDLLSLAVREAREELGWTQAELSLATRTVGQPVSTRTICYLEAGNRNVRVSSIEAVAKALGTTGTGLLLQGEVVAQQSEAGLVGATEESK